MGLGVVRFTTPRRRATQPSKGGGGGGYVSAGLVWAAAAVWAAMGLYVSFTDVRRGVIPRRAVWPAGAAVALLLGGAAVLAGELVRLGWAIGTAAVVALALEVAYRIWPDKMGFGDVRLIVVNSLLAGWWGPAWALWALMAGALAAWPVALAALMRYGRTATVRWAPGLVAGTAMIVAWRLWSDGAVPLFTGGGG